MSALTVDVSGPIATITHNRPDSYNALTEQGERKLVVLDVGSIN
jgi:enoyl-CoA hydratase/carnithine racemase